MKIRIDSRTLPVGMEDVAHNLALITRKPIDELPMSEGEYSLTFKIVGGGESDLTAINDSGYMALKA